MISQTLLLEPMGRAQKAHRWAQIEHNHREIVLKPVEEEAQVIEIFKGRLARPEGLEPPAYWFEANRSIRLSYGRGSDVRDLHGITAARAKIISPVDSRRIQAAIKELQDAMVVMAHMEARQTDRLLRQEKEIEELSLSRARVDPSVLRLREESAVFQRRTEQDLAGITDKLNG